MKRILLFVFLLIVPLFGLAKEYITPSGIKIFIEEPQVEWKLSTKEYTLPSGLRYVVEELVAIPRSLKYAANNFIPIAKAAEMTFLDELKLWIKSFAEQFKVDGELMIKLAQCESGLDPEAFNPKDPQGGAYGLFQYLRPTFEKFKKEANMPELEYKSWQDQIKLTAWAFANKKYPPHWLNCAHFIKYGEWPKK